MKQQKRRDDKAYIRKIEFALYNENEIRWAVADAKEDSNSPDFKNGSGLPDPTATAAILHLSPVKAVMIDGQILKNPEDWLTVIDKTYSWCKRQGETFYKAARGRYSGKHFVRICAELGLTVSLFYDIVKEVKNYAALQAAQLNLIYVD